MDEYAHAELARPRPKHKQKSVIGDDPKYMSVCVRGPNAKVQGRALGVAEAMRRIGVPCNAQLGEWLMRMSEACVGPHLNKPSMRFASVLVGLSPL